MNIAENLQQKWVKMNSVYNITSNPTVDTLKRALLAVLEPDKWNSAATVETLKRVPSVVWDLCIRLFDRASLMYQKRDELSHNWFHGVQPYLKAEYLQQKWNQMDAKYKVTEIAADVFSQVYSNVENFFGYMAHSINTALPPETRNEQIRHWLYVAGLCLLAYIGLRVCLGCFSCIFWCFASIFKYLFMFITSIVGFIFWCMSSIVKLCFYPVSAIFRCFCFGGKSAVKLMKAPGRPTMMIARVVFEADPQGYFANLRGKR
ncbi:hypothetical protein L2E82_44590 [Cichorium intybus]|uniref:Uncharacterized protein n=1 Tax=Cichorium intybus TaxID=13427 RepID=A0ACB8ZQQ2_CICIN|nr:hypothetical protein L2E82_44590 [Cichorium intybus]